MEKDTIEMVLTRDAILTALCRIERNIKNAELESWLKSAVSIQDEYTEIYRAMLNFVKEN